ncbi:MAG: flippase-like domain-containing protein [Chloroflexi bacterium]|nr:flippase-like domain-containing protein [Chloroflexota bacterium]
MVPVLISSAGVAAVVYFLAARIDISFEETWRIIRGVSPGQYLLAVAIDFLAIVLRGARWRVMLVNVARNRDGALPVPSLRYCTSVIFLNRFVNAVTGFRMGDVFRAYAYSEDQRASFSRSIGTVLADRVVDLTVVGILAIGALAILYASGDVRPSIQFLVLAVVLLGGIAGVLVAMFAIRGWTYAWLPRRLRELYGRVHEGTMESLSRLHLIFSLGVLAWACEVGKWFLILTSLGASVSVGLLLFVPPTNVLLTALPFTPGGLGVVEAGIVGLLRLQLTIESAIAVAVVNRSVSLLTASVGGVVFAVRQVRIMRHPIDTG